MKGAQNRSTSSERGLTVIRDMGMYHADAAVSRFRVANGAPEPVPPSSAPLASNTLPCVVVEAGFDARRRCLVWRCLCAYRILKFKKLVKPVYV